MSVSSVFSGLQARAEGVLAAPLRGPYEAPVRRAQRRSVWEAQYVRGIRASDAVASFLAAAVAYVVRFGDTQSGIGPIVYAWAAAAIPLLWLLCMTLSRAYEARFLGVGAEEYQRVLTAAISLTAAVGTVSWALELQIARGFVVIALPTATVLTLAGRYRLRKQLHQRRDRGESTQQVVAVGHPDAVAGLVEHMRRERYHGMDIVAACVPTGVATPELTALNVPILGNFHDIIDVVEDLDADVVAVLTSPEMDGAALRLLGWALEPTRAELVVAPSLMEVGGPRIAIRPVMGLPLLHVERPELGGIRRFAKGCLDWGGATVGLLVFAPILITLAIAIRVDSRGPVFFRQTRVGRHGHEFTMVKFRTMVVDAEARLVDLLAANDGDGVLFKLRSDPRITRIGRILRKYSLDELPQLLNVCMGHMSLVGPRPPLPREVAQYGEDVRRRLLVKPGLTGLWQVNGRSDLEWDESVRLDLRYVENWSFAFDVLILWKTAAAVLRSEGAY